MNLGRTVFAQLVVHLSSFKFHTCVNRYRGNHRVRSFSCWDQLLCMLFAQLTYRRSLRDIVACLRSLRPRLYHMGIQGTISKSTLADANEVRDWRIYRDFAMLLIEETRPLYADEDLGLDLDNSVYALDSTVIDLCVSLYPWALYKSRQHAIKLHTQLDLRGNIPSFIRITPAQMHDVNFLATLVPEPGACYVMDKGYLDFSQLHRWTTAGAFFVIRPRNDLRFRRIYSWPADRTVGLRCDQIIELFWTRSVHAYPDRLRRIRYVHPETRKTLIFLTNNFDWPSLTVCDLYRLRWQVELFFKWIKQHLRILEFYGTSANAVKLQVWTAITAYVLVALVKKRLGLEPNLYTILQILSVTLFEKTPIIQVFSERHCKMLEAEDHNQLSLFDF